MMNTGIHHEQRISSCENNRHNLTLKGPNNYNDKERDAAQLVSE